jgi:hypothetical protein
MKRPLIAALFLVLLLAPSINAASDYWTVNADDGKAVDVVAAANFAASMKANAGVSFSGRTDSQLPSNLGDAFLVRIQGDEATISVRGSADSSLVELAAEYLQHQGFSVDVQKRPTSMTVEPDIEDYPAEDQATTEDEPQEEPKDYAPVPPPTIADAIEPLEPPLPELVEEPQERPGIFSRLWNWFAELFS